MTQVPGIQYESVDPHQAIDVNHLRLLAIFHYIWGGITAAISSIFIIHVVLGILVVSGSMPGPPPGQGAPPPAAFGWMFIGIGGCAVLMGWTVGILTIYSGRCLARQRNRTFSFVMAAINCISIPFGTTLGIFTIVVLVRPSVRMMYEGYRK